MGLYKTMKAVVMGVIAAWVYTRSFAEVPPHRLANGGLPKTPVYNEFDLRSAIASDANLELLADIYLTNGEIFISSVIGLTVYGNGHKIDGQGNYRCVFINGTKNTASEISVIFDSVVITNGSASDGGGLFVIDATVELRNCSVQNNSAFNSVTKIIQRPLIRMILD